jgi:hypothetical protein
MVQEVVLKIQHRSCHKIHHRPPAILSLMQQQMVEITAPRRDCFGSEALGVGRFLLAAV